MRVRNAGASQGAASPGPSEALHGRTKGGAATLTIEDFGRQLIETGDLDPVYIALFDAGLEHKHLCRLLMAYWCFYHLGVSAWLSEQPDFWDACLTAAENKKVVPFLETGMPKRWPRGAERRHFRGSACVRAIEVLSRMTPEAYLAELSKSKSVRDVLCVTVDWPLFGPWIGYKIADMLDRLAFCTIEFTDEVCLIYKEPRAALHDRAPVRPDLELHRLRRVFANHLAPPRYERSCYYSEVETVLCKHKSYLNGHYWVGKDIREIREGLRHWGSTADQLRACCPPEVKEGLFA